MRRRLLILAILLTVILTACNLGTPQETEEPLEETPLATIEPTGKPAVEIISPTDGDEFEVNKPILVSVNATDTAGVTGIQLVVNGAIVKRVSSNSAAGEKNFPTVLDYTPRTTGEVNMQVLAFRGSTPSDPASLTVEVVAAAGSGSSGSGSSGSGSSGGGSAPVQVVIPNDGVCRALTTVNLNFRKTPINGDVIQVLSANTLAPIVARLGDNSWWKINVSGTIGWVSAQYATLSGNCFSVPVENLATATPRPTNTPVFTFTPRPTNTPTAPTNTPQPGTPDLLVTSISGQQSVTLGGGTSTSTYSVTITNLGAGPAGAFKVVLSINNEATTDWVVSGLNRGESVALTTDLTWDTAGTFNLRADADTEGKVTEISDFNNRGDTTVTVKN